MSVINEYIEIKDIKEYLKVVKESYGNELSSGYNTFTNVKDMAYLSATTVNDGIKGSIGIVKSLMTTNSIKKHIYLISLGGLAFVKGQATSLSEEFLASLNLGNDYIKEVKMAILNNIPFGSDLVLTGYSLGGMVAQQIAADKDIISKYYISNVVAIGSPLTASFKRKGNIKRICDINDGITSLKLCSSFYDKLYIYEKVIEDGVYKTPIGTHTLSYVGSSVWNKYDPLGILDGDTLITFVKEDITYY